MSGDRLAANGIAIMSFALGSTISTIWFNAPINLAACWATGGILAISGFSIKAIDERFFNK